MINVFFHKKDLDGHSSGAIARYYYETVENKEVKMWPFDYGEQFPFEEINDGEDVVMLDITTNPYEVMLEINDRYNLFVIDHHKSFIDSGIAEKIKEGIFISGEAACQLTWKYYFPRHDMPEMIKLLGDYDVWKNEDKDYWFGEIMPVQMGVRMSPTDPSDKDGITFWSYYFDKSLATDTEEASLFLGEVKYSGNIILAYQVSEDMKDVNLYSFDATFNGLKAICMNCTRPSSQKFQSVWDNEKYDIMVAWASIKGEYYTVSLYTDKDGVDVSKIAREYGGGGHVQAAGFQCDFVDVLVNDKGEKTLIVRR
jgi:hypothetical protein